MVSETANLQKVIQYDGVSPNPRTRYLRVIRQDDSVGSWDVPTVQTLLRKSLSAPLKKNQPGYF